MKAILYEMDAPELYLLTDYRLRIIERGQKLPLGKMTPAQRFESDSVQTLFDEVIARCKSYSADFCELRNRIEAL